VAGLFDRIAAWFGRDSAKRAEEGALVEDDVERERLEQDYQAARDDAAGSAGANPSGMNLPTGTPGSLYDEFQQDERAPEDPAP
jgi:hypothetical protein